MKSMLIAVMALATVGACAQTAKVIALSDGDAAQIKSLYQQRTELDAKIANAEASARTKYTTVLDDDPDASSFLSDTTVTGETWTTTTSCALSLSASIQEQLDYSDCLKRQKATPKKHFHTYRRGWEAGINYTADFKFIVPEEKPLIAPSNTWPCHITGAVAY